MNRLKELRQGNNLTLKELSQELAKQNIKIAPDTLAKYERGERNPKIDKLEALSEFYNVSVSYLQGKDELKLYFFSQWEDPYGTYNEFTVLAKSEDDAWKQIKEKMKEPEGYGTDYNGNTYPCFGTYEHNRSVYKVKCYPVDKSVVIRHFSAD